MHCYYLLTVGLRAQAVMNESCHARQHQRQDSTFQVSSLGNFLLSAHLAAGAT